MGEYDAMRDSGWVIRCFRGSATERLSSRQRVKDRTRIERTALRTLVMLDAAEALEDLRVPPTPSRLEALHMVTGRASTAIAARTSFPHSGAVGHRASRATPPM